MPRRKPEDPSKVRVRVLGATEITVGHRRIGMNTEVLFGLALYLTTRAGERISREELLELFWGEAGDEDHRHALRQLMYRLRQKGLDVDDAGELIRLDPERVDSDLRSALAEGWWESATAEAIDAACEWGPIFSRNKAPAFLEWVDGVRSDLAKAVRRSSLRLINVARREGRWADLDRWARVILKSDPLNEEATLARAESAAMAGSKTIALEIIDNYLAEIGDVSPDLGKPVLQLRKRIAERRPDWAMRGPKEVPLVGRTELMTKLTGLVEDVWRGEGRAVVLTGAAGIGKTRLAMEVRAYAELKGIRTLLVRSQASNSARPLSVVQRIVADLLETPGAAGCQPDSLRLLQRALERSQALSRRDVASFMYSISAEIPDAVADLIEAIVHEGRLLVLIDDLHYADAESVAALASLFGATVATRVGWLSTMRLHTLEHSRAEDMLAAASTVHVGPLSGSESASLALSTSSQHGIPLSAELAAEVARASGGNALFVRELAVASRTRPSADRMPESLSRVIDARLARVGAKAREVLRVVSLLGIEATLSRVERAVSASSSALASDIEALERDGVVSFSDSRALVLHDCWSQAVFDSMSGATRAIVGRACADSICADPLEMLDPHASWKAAELYAESGDSGRAGELFDRAADGLYGAGLPSEAVQVLRVALALPCTEQERLARKSRLVTSLVAAGDPRSAIAESDDAITDRLYSVTTLKEHAALMIRSRVEALFKTGHPMDREIDLLLALCSDPDIDENQRAECSLTGIAWAANAGDTRRRDAFAAAVPPLQRSTAARLVRIVHEAERGPAERLSEALEALTVDSLSADSKYMRCRALRVKCRGLRLLTRNEEALAAALLSRSIARESRFPYDTSIVTEQIVHLHLDYNDLTSARHWLSELECEPALQSYERRSALEHARERLRIQTGSYADVVSGRTSREAEIQADWNVQRKLTETATLAYALVHVGDEARARVLADEVSSLAAPLTGHFMLDYPIELVARIWNILHEVKASRDLAEAHVEAAIRSVSRQFPPFYQALNESRTALLRV